MGYCPKVLIDTRGEQVSEKSGPFGRLAYCRDDEELAGSVWMGGCSKQRKVCTIHGLATAYDRGIADHGSRGVVSVCK
jgi:hypothetical protein